MIPPTFPTSLRRAISEGSDQPTGAAADNPPMEILIQIRAHGSVCMGRAQQPNPTSSASNQDALRTKLAFQPR